MNADAAGLVCLTFLTETLYVTDFEKPAQRARGATDST